MVQKYEPMIRRETWCHPDPDQWTHEVSMEHSPNGKWVKLSTYKDAVASLESQLEKQRALVKSLQSQLECGEH